MSSSELGRLRRTRRAGARPGRSVRPLRLSRRRFVAGDRTGVTAVSDPRAMWEERYGADGYVYGTDPNSFLADRVDDLPRGS